MYINPGRRTLELFDICQSKVTRGALSLGAMNVALHFHETNPCCGEPYVSSEISSGGFEEIQVQSRQEPNVSKCSRPSTPFVSTEYPLII